MKRRIPESGEWVRITLLRDRFLSSPDQLPAGTVFEGPVAHVDRIGFFGLETSAGPMRFFTFDNGIAIEVVPEPQYA